MMRMSSLIRDPVVRAAFERAERDYGQSFAIPDEPPAVLDGGQAEPVPARTEEGQSWREGTGKIAILSRRQSSEAAS